MSERLYSKIDTDLDEDIFEMRVDDFCFEVGSVIKKYEKRYSSKVRSIALIGKLGRWNGTFDVGKIVNPDGKSILRGFGSDCTVFEVFVGEKGELTVYGYHHDGKVALRCYLVSESKYERFGLALGNLEPESAKLNSLEKNLTRIKLNY